MSGTSHSPAVRPQLKMVWPEARLDERPAHPVPSGYRLAQADPSSEASFLALMEACGWEFDDRLMAFCYSRLLPDGWFVVRSDGDGTDDDGTIVASAMSLHNYTERSPCSGTLGWVGCLPQHRGRSLGAVVSAAATARLLQGGYTNVELYTEHFRLPAIETYFRLGFIPYIYSPAVEEVWSDVCRAIGRRFEPHAWPHGTDAHPTC